MKKNQRQKIVKRQVFENLYTMKYQEDAEQWKNASYEEYLDNTIRLKVATVNPFDLDIDEFAQNINFVDSDVKPIARGEDSEVDEETQK